MKPVDLQVVVPKSYETGRIQQNLKNINQAHQSLLSTQSNEKLKRDRHKVTEKAKSEHVKLDTRKGFKQNKNSPKKRKKRKKHIDIRI